MLLSDEEAREVVLLLSQTEEKHANCEDVLNDNIGVMNTTVTHDVFDTTVIHDGTEYHFLEDGHYYFEYPGLNPIEDSHEMSLNREMSFDVCTPPKKKTKIQFSTAPIKVFLLYKLLLLLFFLISHDFLLRT